MPAIGIDIGLAIGDDGGYEPALGPSTGLVLEAGGFLTTEANEFLLQE